MPNPGTCLHRGCNQFHPNRDIYGLCPQHHPAPAANRREAELSLNRDYPAIHNLRPRPAEPMKVQADEVATARRMLARLSSKQLAVLLNTTDRVPAGPEWRRSQGSCIMPTFMSGVARAVALGEYQVVEA